MIFILLVLFIDLSWSASLISEVHIMVHLRKVNALSINQMAFKRCTSWCTSEKGTR